MVSRKFMTPWFLSDGFIAPIMVNNGLNLGLGNR